MDKVTIQRPRAVLLSGGIDSAVCLTMLRSAAADPMLGVFIDYGQAAAVHELEAARAIAYRAGTRLHVLTLVGATRKIGGRIEGRNAFLLCAALMELGTTVSLIGIGIHAGTQYEDCSPVFVAKMQQVFDLYTGGAVQIATPLINWTKAQVWEAGKTLGVQLDSTYSCEVGAIPPCGSCSSCRDRETLLAGP